MARLLFTILVSVGLVVVALIFVLNVNDPRDPPSDAAVAIVVSAGAMVIVWAILQALGILPRMTGDSDPDAPDVAEDDDGDD